MSSFFFLYLVWNQFGYPKAASFYGEVYRQGMYFRLIGNCIPSIQCRRVQRGLGAPTLMEEHKLCLAL